MGVSPQGTRGRRRGGSRQPQAAAALARLRRLRPTAARIAIAAITTNRPSRTAGSTDPTERQGNQLHDAGPDRQQHDHEQDDQRMPRMRARMPAEAGGTSSPMALRANSWRPLGGAWPRRSTAVLRSPARRSARAREASAMRRMSSAPAAARWRWRVELATAAVVSSARRPAPRMAVPPPCPWSRLELLVGALLERLMASMPPLCSMRPGVVWVPWRLILWWRAERRGGPAARPRVPQTCARG